MADTSCRAGQRKFCRRLRNFLHRNSNAEELRQTEGTSHSSRKESTRTTPPELTAHDHKESCEPVDASDSTGVEDSTASPESVEQSRRRKVLSSIREASQKIKGFGGKTKSFLKRIKERMKDKFSKPGSSVSDNLTGLGSQDETESKDSSVQKGWTLVCAEQCKEETCSPISVQGMLRDAPEEVTECVDITGSPSGEVDPNFVTIVCSPSDMNPVMFAYLCDSIGICDNEIDGDDIILTFRASSVEEVADILHPQDLYYKYSQADDGSQGSYEVGSRRHTSAEEDLEIVQLANRSPRKAGLPPCLLMGRERARVGRPVHCSEHSLESTREFHTDGVAEIRESQEGLFENNVEGEERIVLDEYGDRVSVSVFCLLEETVKT